MTKLNPPEETSTFMEHPLVQAVAGKVPIVSALTTFWVETVRSKREKALYTFLHEVASEIETLRKGNKYEVVDVKHIASEDFAETIANVTELVIHQKDDEKKEYLKRFVVNYSKQKRPDINLRKIFFQIIREISGAHLLILDQIYSCQSSLSDSDLYVLNEQLDRPEALSVKKLTQLLELNEDLISILGSMLENRGLIKMTSVSDNYTDNTPRLIMLPLARRFMDFLQN